MCTLVINHNSQTDHVHTTPKIFFLPQVVWLQENHKAPSQSNKGCSDLFSVH